MTKFIATYPGTIYIILTLFGLLVVYLWRSNESKAALLIATKLDQIVEKLDVLFAKVGVREDEAREIERRAAKLAKDLATQKQRCDDRERSCPGKLACKTLDRQGKT